MSVASDDSLEPAGPSPRAMPQSTPMRAENVPALGIRYWVVISLASIAGCNLGDFVSLYLHLDHLLGLLPLALILAILLTGAQRASLRGEGWYWAIILIVRTAATNLADLATHTMGLSYPWTIAALEAILVFAVLPVRPRLMVDGDLYGRPYVDAWYWGAMLTAGTLGTAVGDCVAEEFNFGTGTGTLILSAILIAILVTGFRSRWSSKTIYWLAVVAVRSAGTTAGDHLAFKDGFHLGLLTSTALSCGVFVATILLWRPSRGGKR
jgi:uncharacterized membrane-anchored protein